MISILIILVLVLVWLIGWWKTFEKAGFKGYEILIPGHSLVIMLQIGKKPIWWFFLFLIPIANIVFYIMMLHAISVNFGKGVGFTLGLIFLPFIFVPILGFGSAEYVTEEAAPQAEAPAAPAAPVAEAPAEEKPAE